MITAAVFMGFLLGQATSSPMPSPMASTCPTTEATVISATEPVFPIGMANMLNGPVTVLAMVTVAVDGSPKAESIIKSSGFKTVDDAVLRAARASTYKPKMFNCEPVQGTYLFRIDYQPN
jgi:TonB family protein